MVFMVKARQECTSWDDLEYRIPQHIYLVDDSSLVGYILEGTFKATYFSKPKKQWSPLGRTFRDIKSKKELSQYDLTRSH